MLILMLTTQFNAFLFCLMLFFLASQLIKTQADQWVLSSVEHCDVSRRALGEASYSLVTLSVYTGKWLGQPGRNVVFWKTYCCVVRTI